MNKSHRYLIPSLSLLLVGSVFSCAKSSKSDDLFAVKTNATITFDVIQGIGTWPTAGGSSIRTLTLLKGYKWGYLKENLKDELKKEIIEAQGIKFIGGPRTFSGDKWVFSDGSKISDDYVINDDVIFRANYDPIYIGATFIADTNPADKHHQFADGSTTKEITKESKIIKEGTKWKDIKNDYIPQCVTGYESEPFLYYQTASGMKVSDEYTLQDTDKLTAVYQINHPSDFMTDSWTTINEAANLGFDSMSTLGYLQGGYKKEYEETSYEYDGHTYSKEENTFVGLRHKVVIGKKSYDAIVVGEDIDKVSNTANATLTFQIEQVVNTSKAYDTLEHNLNRYSESALREYLNNNFRYTLSPDLQNVIVPVNKRTNWGGKEDSQGDVRESMEYVFAFSLAELGLTSTKTGEVEAEGFGDNYKDSYAYYKNATSDKRIRKTLKNVALPYWVRSPDCDAPGFAWAIGEDGNIKYEDNTPPSSDITLSLGVVCGFSVGAKR